MAISGRAHCAKYCNCKFYYHVYSVITGRAKLWTRQMAGVMDLGNTYCSDGFFINFCAVMLRFCKPFADPKSTKLLKVQPTYCVATAGTTEELKKRSIHMKGIGFLGILYHCIVPICLCLIDLILSTVRMYKNLYDSLYLYKLLYCFNIIKVQSNIRK